MFLLNLLASYLEKWLVNIPACTWITIKNSVYIIIAIPHFVLRIGAVIPLTCRFVTIEIVGIVVIAVITIILIIITNVLNNGQFFRQNTYLIRLVDLKILSIKLLFSG